MIQLKIENDQLKFQGEKMKDEQQNEDIDVET
jgi:hypothetical protein